MEKIKSPQRKYLAVNLVRGDFLTSTKNRGIQNELMAPQLVPNSQLHTVPMTTALGFSVSKPWNSCDQNGIRMCINSWSSLQILGRIHFWDTCVIKGVYQIVSQMYLAQRMPTFISIFNIVDLLFCHRFPASPQSHQTSHGTSHFHPFVEFPSTPPWPLWSTNTRVAVVVAPHGFVLHSGR